MATTRLTRTLGTPTNRKKLTLSMWLKKSFNGVEKHFFGMGNSGGYLDFRFASTGELELYHYNSGYQFRLTTTRKFRDTNAWYHLVFAIDTTLGTADDRFKVYVNGVQETVFTNRTNPSTDYELGANANGNTISVGNYGTNTGNSFDGLISHVHFSDGYVYQASDFGSTDSTTGEWKIKTSPSGITYGTNGFWWLKDDIATTDHSPNSNTFTVASGTLTKTEDNPSNIFATWNTLAQPLSSITYSNGSTVATMTGDVGQRQSISTLGMDSGKFYMECKLQAMGSTGGSYPYVGITAQEKYDADMYLGGNGTAWHPTGDIYNGHSNSSTGSTYTTGDFIGVAVDVTNSKLYWHKNGTYITIGGYTQNPSTGSYGFDISARTAEGALGFGVSSWNNSGIWQVNFGNGVFGSTQLTGTTYQDSNGQGVFKYQPPTNFLALCTKNLNV